MARALHVGLDLDRAPYGCLLERAEEGGMRLIDTIKNRLGLDFSEQASREVKREEDAAGRKSAERYSRGSVGIQKGAFETRDDIDRELARAGIPPAPPHEH